MSVRFALMLFLPALGTLAQEPHQPAAAPSSPANRLPASPADLAAGAALFQVHCALCHGPRGEGGKGPALAQPFLPRAPDDAALLRVIAGGIPLSEMPGSQLPAPAIAQIAAHVRALGRLPPERLPGDAARGAQLYAGKGACATCHAIHGRGSAFGPDLTAIGARRSAAYLRRALLDPAADLPQSSVPYRSDVSLPENFLFVRATTRDGRALAGARINEDAFSLQLREPSGRVHSLFKSELATLHKDRGFSPMPAYGEIFSIPELDNLVAYLASLRGQK
ncbi:MAG: c-type cytochrome [Opitutaceae bacterium]|nr:c-type cytochrome [Opitutaceae bacterium]